MTAAEEAVLATLREMTPERIRELAQIAEEESASATAAKGAA